MPPSPRQPRRIRTLARRGLILLLVGLVSTVGMAVLLAVNESPKWVPPTRERLYGLGGVSGRFAVPEFGSFGGWRAQFGFHDWWYDGPELDSASFARELLAGANEALVQARGDGAFPPRWARLDTTFPVDEPPDRHYKIIVDARGWPSPALWCEWRERSPRVLGHALGGIDLSGSNDWPRAIPLRPVWAGLALDTLVHAAIWGGLWQGLIFARSRRRLRRGLCSSCAYSLAGLPENTPCPECGAARRAGVPKEKLKA